MNSTRLKRSLGLRDDGVAALLKKEYTIWDQCYLCQTGKHNYKLAVGKRDSCIVATFDVRKQKLIRGVKAATVIILRDKFEPEVRHDDESAIVVV